MKGKLIARAAYVIERKSKGPTKLGATSADLIAPIRVMVSANTVARSVYKPFFGFRANASF